MKKLLCAACVLLVAACSGGPKAPVGTQTVVYEYSLSEALGLRFSLTLA